MDLRRLTPTLSVAPQIAPDELSAAAAAGFTTLICNRPDGEQPGQPDHEAMARGFGGAGHGLVLAYCRSGTRSTQLWALSQAGKRPWSEVLQAAAAAGYDLSRMPPPAAAQG